MVVAFIQIDNYWHVNAVWVAGAGTHLVGIEAGVVLLWGLAHVGTDIEIHQALILIDIGNDTLISTEDTAEESMAEDIPSMFALSMYKPTKLPYAV